MGGQGLREAHGKPLRVLKTEVHDDVEGRRKIGRIYNRYIERRGYKMKDFY